MVAGRGRSIPCVPPNVFGANGWPTPVDADRFRRGPLQLERGGERVHADSRGLGTVLID
jgi:hypothetical protein